MIKKIISGGQAGADRAALDAAIWLGIEHGGWASKGRLAEDGPIPEKYRLLEMRSGNETQRIEQNVLDSDGTLIITHGALSGDCADARKMAMKHKKPWFHADLNRLPTFQASIIVEDWIAKEGIETLNITGSRAAKDGTIYGLVTVMLELVFTLRTAKDRRPEQSGDVAHAGESADFHPPATIDEAVAFLISKLSLKDKSTIAKMAKDDLHALDLSLGRYIRARLFYPRNDQLLESCRCAVADKYLHWEQAPRVIIKNLWQALKKTHKLRIVR
jgi:hypothetical protein